jgi:hypothetical protein
MDQAPEPYLAFVGRISGTGAWRPHPGPVGATPALVP